MIRLGVGILSTATLSLLSFLSEAAQSPAGQPNQYRTHLTSIEEMQAARSST